MRRMLDRAFGVLALAALLAVAGRASAQPAALDRAVEDASVAHVEQRKPLAWHDSSVVWVQRASTQTLGVGPKPLSPDPYYDWLLYLRPRYYFWEDDTSSLSVRGQLELDHEFTNSDTTTEKNETLLGDSILALVPEHAFVARGEYLTLLSLSLPRVVLPTAKASYNAGNIAQVGVRAFLLQDLPLRENEAWLPRARLALRAGYSYQFARYVVPELSTLSQLRMDLEGHSVSNNQIAGAALPEHLFIFHGLAGADIWRNVVGFDAEFGIDPAFKFPLQNHTLLDFPLTGPTEVQTVDHPQRYGVLTLLDVYLEARALQNALHVALGYENVTNQLAPASRYRSPLWSPDAHFYLRLEFVPDLLIEPPAPTAPRAGPAPGRNVASLR
jgi:hypothetical protein